MIGYVWPEPNSSAAGTRIVELIHAFTAAGWTVDFACAAAPSTHQISLQDLGVAKHEIILNCSSFNTWIEKLAPDVVIFDRYLTEEQFGWRVQIACPEALRVIDTEDFHSLRAARQLLYKEQQKEAGNNRDCVLPVEASNEKLYQTMLREDMAYREVAAIFRSDLSLMISTFEIHLLQTLFGVPEALLHYLPFMLNNTAPNKEKCLSFSERNHFITIGNFRHPPNWDAVLWLKHELWPKIYKKLPKAELHIYGAYPPKKATQLHNPKEGFYIKGWAENAQQVMAESKVCLAPLRFGAGIKGKLIDAMQTKTPSVTTTIGAEGMHGDFPWPGGISNAAEDFANKAIQFYTDSEKWQTASAQALPILNSLYNGKQLAAGLIEKIQSLCKLKEQHRQQNFIGAMLNHHSHKSTEFMSRWIEAKSHNLPNETPKGSV